MATIKPTSATVGAGVTEYVWAGVTEADIGAAVQTPAGADKTLQIDGTFGSGGDGAFRGSNDGASYFTLTDPDAVAISLVAAGLRLIRESPKLVRPEIAAGTGVSLNFRLIVKRTT